MLKCPADEKELNWLLSEPAPALIEMMKRLEGDIAILVRNKKLGIPAIVLAVLIAFSRMYLYVHYPTDVIASVILGSLFALIGTWIVNFVAGKIEAKKAQPAA